MIDNIKTRRLRFAGHVYRLLQDQPAQQLLFWQSSHRYRGQPHKGIRPSRNVLIEDTGMEPNQLRLLMSDRGKWRQALIRNSFLPRQPGRQNFNIIMA